MKVFITRHGETEWNKLHKVCGRTDIPLTDNGRAQAEALSIVIKDNKDYYDIKKIYVSPLIRALETASYTEKALGLEAIKDERLMEMYFGEFEGVDWDDAEFHRIKYSMYEHFPGGESNATMTHRLYSFLDSILSDNKDLDGNILIVCHGTAARTLMTYFRSFTDDELKSIRVANCQLLEFEV